MKVYRFEDISKYLHSVVRDCIEQGLKTSKYAIGQPQLINKFVETKFVDTISEGLEQYGMGNVLFPIIIIKSSKERLTDEKKNPEAIR